MPPEPPLRDATLFAEIVEAHEPALRRYALRMVRNAVDAEELVAATHERAWKNFARFQRGTNAAGWLVSIMSRLFLDELKHKKVERKAEPDLMVSEAVEFTPAILRITDADLYEAVQALEPALREVVELCYFQQKRRSEAAAILHIPEGTVGTRLMRARERLHQLLTAAPGDLRKP